MKYKPYKPKPHPRADDIAAAQPPIRHIVGPRKVDKKRKQPDNNPTAPSSGHFS